MKKLLLVLMVVALASFLFVGCLPTTPPADGDGDGDGVAEICPTIAITGSYTDAVTGKTYVGSAAYGLELTVTYTQPTEGVKIFVINGSGPWMSKAERDKAGIWDIELPYSVSPDGLTYTATVTYNQLWNIYSCDAFMISIEDCYGECECVQSFILDYLNPRAKMMLSVPDCLCGGCDIYLTSDYDLTASGDCVDTLGCCGDDCSGLASWTVDIYNQDPFDKCCTVPCAPAITPCSGAACPIDCTTTCVAGDDSAVPVDRYYIVMSMLDNVGNETNYYATVKFDSGCTVTQIEFWDDHNQKPVGSSKYKCLDWDKKYVLDDTDNSDLGYLDAEIKQLSNGTYYAIIGEACGSTYTK